MQLKIIGTGSSGNSMLLENADMSILLDCGMPITELKKALNFKVSKLKFAICSHVHNDHSAYISKILCMGIPVYMPMSVKEQYAGYSNAIQVEPMNQISVNGITFIPFIVPHDGVECFAYIIKWEKRTIAWLTDLEYCPYSLAKLGLTDIFVECNYVDDEVQSDIPNYEHKLLGHMGLTACTEFIKHNVTENLQNIVLIHASESLNSKRVIDQISEMANKPVWVARKGMVVDITRKDLNI